MSNVKKLIMLHVPTSICNFRCHYCYLAQRNTAYQGIQPKMNYSPQQVRKALSVERMGGPCFINACAEGETLLTENIDLYFKELVEEGHYLEIVTNLTVTPMINKILSWDAALLRRVEFKCSFHYLELKKHKLLEVFATNVNKVWEAGASATIEITPSDELIPYIDEVKNFSLKHFGALPHLTIARDDRTKEIAYLTKLSDEEYEKAWSGFRSGLWEYKRTIFGVKQTGFCYAGLWSFSVNLATGNAAACYYMPLGNIFEDPEKPFPFRPIGKCPIAHCYNGHAFLTFDSIPGSTNYCYCDMRNRRRDDGREWLQPEMKAFFSSKLTQSNEPWPKRKEACFMFRVKVKQNYKATKRKIKHAIRGIIS